MADASAAYELTADLGRQERRRHPATRLTSRYDTFHLLPEGCEGLLVAVRAYRAALAGVSGLDLVPDPGLHLTVQGVGLVGSVSRGELEDIVGKARLELSSLAPFSLEFAAAEVDSEGVVMNAGPVQPVAQLRLLLRNAIAEVLGRDRLAGPDGEPVWPHMSLAYANAPMPAGPLQRALRNVGFHSASSYFDHVSLIELRREEHLYAWDLMAGIGFAGSTEPTSL